MVSIADAESSGINGRLARRPRTALARRRRTQGLSQELLAERVGVARTTVARWESGLTTPLAWARPKLAAALGITLEDVESLLTDDLEPHVATVAVAEGQENLGNLLLVDDEVASLAGRLASLPDDASKADYLAAAVAWIIELRVAGGSIQNGRQGAALASLDG